MEEEIIRELLDTRDFYKIMENNNLYKIIYVIEND